MNVKQRQPFPVFLSSLCKRAPGLEELRATIYDKVGHKKYVYVDEGFTHRNIHQQDDLEAADELISRVREAETVICILAGTSHGSPITVEHVPSSTSFFEIELYQAALLKKCVRHAIVITCSTPS